MALLLALLVFLNVTALALLACGNLLYCREPRGMSLQWKLRKLTKLDQLKIGKMRANTRPTV